jgi:hypothetical protein
MEILFDFFLSNPGRLVLLGRTIVYGAWIPLLAGLVGRIAFAGQAAVALIGRAPATSDLASLYPTLPTFFVPESVVGFALWIAVGLAGVWTVHVGKKWERFFQ